MSSQGQSVDDLICCLMGMGFEFDDCQQAVENGKLSVQDAVDWLLAGKPQAAAAAAAAASPGQGTLRLGRPADSIGSNPFSNPQSAFVSPPVAAVPSPEAEGSAVSEGEDQIKSRMHVSDEQRQQKQQFEEKQRMEERKRAQEEKVAKKKARDQVLAEIQKDKEDKEMRKAKATASPTKDSPAEGASAAVTPPGGRPAEAGASRGDSALLQIRLPSGQVFKHSFHGDDPLKVVWEHVQTKYHITGGMVLMQPFPRKEFGANQMDQSLRDLGLVPTSSLVLRKSDATVSVPTCSPEPMDTQQAAPPVPGDEAGPAPLPPSLPASLPAPLDHPPLPGPPQQGTRHHWGSGHKTGDEMEEDGPHVAAPDEPMDSDGGDDDSDDSGSDDFGAGGLPGMGGGGGPGFFPGGGAGRGGGGFGGGGGMPGFGRGGGGMPGFPGMPQVGVFGQQQVFEGFGQRLMPEVLNMDDLPHHNRDPKMLAAEAARLRYANQPECEVDQECAAVGGLSYSVARLTDLLIQHVSSRICDSRNPITGLQGLPPEVATKVLQYLITERLLKPKTIQPFVSCHLRKLVLDCYPYVTNDLLSAIRLHSSLVHLSLCGCPLITDKGLLPLKSLKRLKYLSMGGCKQLSNKCIPLLADLTALVTLILEDTGVSDEGISAYAATKPEHLVHLDLSRTQVTHHILPVLAAIPTLKTLSLEQTKVASLSCLPSLLGLTMLNLAATPIVTEALMCLKDMHSLRALNIANTPNVESDLALSHIAGLHLEHIELPNRLLLTDVGVRHLANMPLVILDLTNYNNITDAAMDSIGQIHSLKKLRLGNTKLTDAGMVLLADLTQLEQLFVDRTNVGNIGAAVISAFSHLQELSMSETLVTNNFLKSGRLNSCTLLGRLNLSRTSISGSGLRHLKLPFLILLNVDATPMKVNVKESLTTCPTEVLPGCPRIARVIINTATIPEGSSSEGEAG